MRWSVLVDTDAEGRTRLRVHDAWAEDRWRRWRRVAVVTGLVLAYVPAILLAIAVLRWDAARTQAVAQLTAELLAARAQATCERSARLRLMPATDAWVSTCLRRETARLDG